MNRLPLRLGLLALASLLAADDLELQRTLSEQECWPWQRLECWSDPEPAFEQETFNSHTEHLPLSIFGVGIPEAFGGTRRPHSRNFLLHYAPGWDTPTRDVPVLLVHGCQSDATRSFASTWFDGRPGLMPFLSARGFAVFAITFPCGQGDLYFQAQHIGNAIEVIKERTGADKVDVVAHSAGGIAARMYLTGVRKSWGRRYQKDIRKLIFAATPHQGLDFTFRHPIAFVRFHAYGMPAPWDWYQPMGALEDNIFAPAYRMQLMLLADLSDLHPLNQKEVDWHTTWHGGEGYVSRSRGLKQAIAEGGDHMAQVRAARFPRRTDIYLLAGTRHELQYIDLGGAQQLEEGEYDGPSDGLVFLESATDPDGFANNGARLRETQVMPCNHVELLFLEEPQTWIATILNGAPIRDSEVLPWPLPSTSERESDSQPSAYTTTDSTVVGGRD